MAGVSHGLGSCSFPAGVMVLLINLHTPGDDKSFLCTADFKVHNIPSRELSLLAGLQMTARSTSDGSAHMGAAHAVNGGCSLASCSEFRRQCVAEDGGGGGTGGCRMQGGAGWRLPLRQDGPRATLRGR
jgi:hypothetical protein